MNIFETWPWGKLSLKLYIVIPVLFCGLLFLLFYPLDSIFITLSLLSLSAGIILFFKNFHIRQKINTLLNCKSAQNGTVTETLISINNKFSPGIAIVRQTVIILIPITGRRRKLQLSNICKISTSIKLQHRIFNSKTSITLETDKASQYTFIIPKSITNQWLEQLLNATGQSL